MEKEDRNRQYRLIENPDLTCDIEEKQQDGSFKTIHTESDVDQVKYWLTSRHHDDYDIHFLNGFIELVKR